MGIHKYLTHIPIIRKKIRDQVLRRKLRFPSLLSIELTNNCNASCIMCPRRKMTRKKTYMELSYFKKIIDDCRNQPLKKINLFWFGESLLYPHFVEALEYIKSNLPSTKVNVSTNGGLLDKKMSERILSQKLVSTINIDLDGVKKETAEKIRPGINFEKVMKNIHELIETKKSLKLSSPDIRITIIKMLDNEKEISDFCSYWRGKVERVEVNQYNTWMNNVPDRGVEKEKQNHTGQFDFPCEHPWNELTVASDGRASLCCLDFDCQAVVGYINKNSISEIWNGEQINFYRNKLLNLDYKKIICQDCNAYIFQKKSFWRSIWV